MRLAKGLHRDSYDHPWRKRQTDARSLLGGGLPALTPGKVVSLRRFEPRTFNQLGYEACTGHAWSLGIVVALAAAGSPLSFVPSPLDIYTLARAIGRGGPQGRLSDTGAQLADVATAISTWGLRPIGALNPRGNTDCTDALINEEPNLKGLILDASTLVTGEYRLDLHSLMAVKNACSLLDAGIPLARGSFVDAPYETYKAGDPAVGAPDESDPNGGGHATVTTGYRVNADGSVEFEDATSWDETFGDAGHVWISASCFVASWDCYPLAIRRAA